jgi:hypothetical protein
MENRAMWMPFIMARFARLGSGLQISILPGNGLVIGFDLPPGKIEICKPDPKTVTS